ncbi:acyltransferase domain-containing protein [Streptosporangium sp. DT93]|uniref:acyltransferase domain-containing protein n=1 Tax=Streptosporangium sp. DT93 TaxID=3393428 RepID=UPI003CFBA512
MAAYAWMFPNPGAHLPGSLGPLLDGDGGEECRSWLKAIDEVAGDHGWSPVSPLLSQAGREEAEGVQHLWLGFFATSVVLAGLLRQAGIEARVYLGHSSGEVTALVAANALTVTDGARVLCERVRAVTETGPPRGAMLALGAGIRRVRDMCGAVDDGSLAVAVDNGPRQVVVSGQATAIRTLGLLAETVGVRATPLDIPGAYHNPMMAAAARRFAETTSEMPVRAPDTPVYSPQLGRVLRGVDDVRELLAGLLVLPVGFRQALRDLYDDGCDTFVECGARTVLSDLVTATLPPAARVVPLLPGRAAAHDLPGTIAALATPLPAGPEVAETAEVAAAPPPVATGLPPGQELVEEIRRMYADVLQYPLDVVTAQVELEAELGVSSVMQTQVFVRLLDRYGLPTPTADVRVFSYRTVEQVAELLRRLAARGR